MTGGIMINRQGSNLTNVKVNNKALILKLISTEKAVSRVDLSRMTNLTKTTSGNIVSELMLDNMICESDSQAPDTVSLGRRPRFLDISPLSPIVAGILIKRGIVSAILADLKGRILHRAEQSYTFLDEKQLIAIVTSLFGRLRSRTDRRIVAVGISSIGPVDTVSGKIVNPPNFFGIHNLPIVDIVTEYTGLPTFLINDSDAGALAEKTYGDKAKELDNLIYLHIMNGIGAGYILHGNIYNGDVGQSGEIGHTSINFSGPVCNCGNVGCLELYANLGNMNKKIAMLHAIGRTSSLLTGSAGDYSWVEILNAAARMDYAAFSALEEFCDYISYALANVINLLDINHVIVGYDAPGNMNIIEDMLNAQLNSKALTAKYRKIHVEKSYFGGSAPLVGSIAVVTDKIFNGEFDLI